MKLLRDVREVTKLLILLEITRSHYSRLKPLADKFGLTIQAVSEYMTIMRREGLVQQRGDIYKPTKKGVDFLQDRFSQIKDFVDSSMKDLRIIHVASALAGEEIEEGEAVGLVIERGRLVAYPRQQASSRGRAAYRARRGEDLAVTELEGIVELKPGTVVVLRLPAAQAGGSRGVDHKKLKARLRGFRPDMVAVVGPVAIGLAKKMAWPTDFEFAPVEVGIDAALKGLNVLLITASSEFEEVTRAIESANAGLEEPIPSKVVNFE